METNNSKSMHPLAMAAGIAVILFSTVGVSAVMGWIPTSFGNTPDGVTSGMHSGNAAKTPAPARVAQNSPAKVKCADCGVVESVRKVEQAGEGAGLGAAGGAVVGGLLAPPGWWRQRQADHDRGWRSGRRSRRKSDREAGEINDRV